MHNVVVLNVVVHIVGMHIVGMLDGNMRTPWLARVVVDGAGVHNMGVDSVRCSRHGCV